MLPDRITRRIRQTPRCWQWLGAQNGVGYGVAYLAPRLQLVHRLMYEEHRGPIPEGLTIDHLCRNRDCVNPAHLEAVTFRENVLRGEGPPAINAAKTHCVKHDELLVEYYETGKRRCRECGRERQREYYARKLAAVA